MLLASRPEQSGLDHVEQVNESLRQFWRMRKREEPDGSTLADQYIDDAGVTPLDSTKTFVGPNGTWYDERWRSMEWHGRRRSWNWAAALSFGGWLAYRKLYPAAALSLAWSGLLLTLAINGIPLWPLALAQLCVLLGLATYGNALYVAKFRRAALRAAKSDGPYENRLAVLARAGGTSQVAVYAMTVAGIAVAGAAIWLTSWSRGEVAFNF